MQRIIEALEARIAPAAVFTYTEADGDKVTIKTTAKISNADFLGYMDSNAEFVDGDLDALELNSSIFRGTSLTISVQKAGGGDGMASIGTIYSPYDLKSVTIKGNLGAIQVGDGNFSTPGIAKLTVNDLGGSGTDSYFAGAGSIQIQGDLKSGIYTEGGSINSIKIAGTIGEDGFIQGNRIKSITVGGDVEGRIGAYEINSVLVKGDLLGNGSDDSGRIEANSINKIRVGGIIGAGGTQSGSISGAHIGTVTVDRSVEGGSGSASGTIFTEFLNKVTVGGSVIGDSGNQSGAIYADYLNAATIRGSLEGGSGGDSGYVWGGNALRKVTVSGNVLGGEGDSSGQIGGSGLIGSIQIGGNLVGGLGEDSGWIGSEESGTIDQITIKGSIIGGGEVQAGVPVGGSGSGRIEGFQIESLRIGKDLEGGATAQSGNISAYSINSLQIGGSIIGGFSENSGMVNTSGLGKVTIGKDVIAGEAASTGFILGYAGIGSLKIGGALRGDLEQSGSIAAFDGSIGSITIGKGITNTGNGITGIYAAGDIGKVVINGNVTGGAYGTIGIRAGYYVGGSIANDSIGSITIKGNVSNFLIEAGLNLNGEVNPDASIGTVKVTGKFETSSIVAGIGAGSDGFYGTDDDLLPSDPNQAVFSRIASVTIGAVNGTAAADDGYGIIAQHIVSLKIKGAKQTLTAGPINDTTAKIFGETEDFRVFEVGSLPIPT